jgi:hypothetical protein
MKLFSLNTNGQVLNSPILPGAISASPPTLLLSQLAFFLLLNTGAYLLYLLLNRLTLAFMLNRLIFVFAPAYPVLALLNGVDVIGKNYTVK